MSRGSTPAFEIESTIAFGRRYVRAGVQNDVCGTYVDLFHSEGTAKSWLKDVLVAYFDFHTSVADAAVEVAFEVAYSVGRL